MGKLFLVSFNTPVVVFWFKTASITSITRTNKCRNFFFCDSTVHMKGCSHGVLLYLITSITKACVHLMRFNIEALLNGKVSYMDGV